MNTGMAVHMPSLVNPPEGESPQLQRARKDVEMLRKKFLRLQKRIRTTTSVVTIRMIEREEREQKESRMTERLSAVEALEASKARVTALDTFLNHNQVEIQACEGTRQAEESSWMETLGIESVVLPSDESTDKDDGTDNRISATAMALPALL